MDLPQDFKPKSFWERPEGTTGMIFIVGIAIALGITGWYFLLPFILTLLKNTLLALLLICVLVFIISLLANNRFRTLLWYGFKSLMRFLTSFFKQIDPIGILKSYVESLEDNVADMEKQISNLNGQMRVLKNTMDDNVKKMNEALSIADKAAKSKKEAVVKLKARKAGRLGESNVTYQNLYTKMEMLYRILLKMRETCLFMIEDIKDEVEMAIQKREMIKASYSAFHSALKVIKGDKDKKAMFDETMEYLAEDYGKKLGEIENFMEMSSSFIESIDIQNGVYEERALEMIEKWEKESDSLLLGNDKRLLIAQAHDPKEVIDLNEKMPEKELVQAKRPKGEDVGYKKLFAEDR